MQSFKINLDVLKMEKIQSLGSVESSSMNQCEISVLEDQQIKMIEQLEKSLVEDK